MLKESYYFSHDTNARNDPKIMALRSKYKYEGYGWYFAFIEMMREQADGKLSMRRQCDFDAFAMQMQCDSETIKKFINDCINEYELFVENDGYFFSLSLLKRMEVAQDKKNKAQISALKRWETKDSMPSQCERNANAMPSQCEPNAIKERKGNKEKEIKERKEEYGEKVSLAPDEYEKLKTKFGETKTLEKIKNLSLYKLSTGKKYASDYATILRWSEKDDAEVGKNKDPVEVKPPVVKKGFEEYEDLI